MLSFFMKGISPNEYRKCRRKDILDIMEIIDAVGEKQIRERMKNKAMRSF